MGAVSDGGKVDIVYSDREIQPQLFEDIEAIDRGCGKRLARPENRARKVRMVLCIGEVLGLERDGSGSKWQWKTAEKVRSLREASAVLRHRLSIPDGRRVPLIAD